MKTIIEIKFFDTQESQVFVKILNKIKDEGVLSAMETGLLINSIQSGMDRIEEN